LTLPRCRGAPRVGLRGVSSVSEVPPSPILSRPFLIAASRLRPRAFASMQTPSGPMTIILGMDFTPYLPARRVFQPPPSMTCRQLIRLSRTNLWKRCLSVSSEMLTISRPRALYLL
jgi:hypothetical protein